MLFHNPNEESELLEEKVPEGVVIRADNRHHARDNLGIIGNIWKKFPLESNNTEDVSLWSQYLCCFSVNLNVIEARPWMKEERDNTSRVGGLSTLPGLYLSTFQPSQRGFFRVHYVCRERKSEPKFLNF